MSWVLLCAITLDTYVERWMGFSIIYYMHVPLMEVLSFHNRYQPRIRILKTLKQNQASNCFRMNGGVASNSINLKELNGKQVK